MTDALPAPRDPRAAVAPVIERFAGLVVSEVAALAVGGSLATGDFWPGVSDIDAVALLDAPLSRGARRRFVAIHRRLVAADKGADALHCVYVDRSSAADARHGHWTWAFGGLFRRPLSGIARAELLADPIVLLGPVPSTWLPPMGESELVDAARAEIAGYWTRAVHRRGIWRKDVYVDLGLTVWARAHATIREGRLITKGEAIGRLRDAGVPGWIVEGVEARREGLQHRLTRRGRARRARAVRTFLARECRRLL